MNLRTIYIVSFFFFLIYDCAIFSSRVNQLLIPIALLDVLQDLTTRELNTVNLAH